MDIPKVVIRPQPQGCVVYVQPPANVAIEKRLLLLGYTLEELTGEGVPDGFKAIRLHSNGYDGNLPATAAKVKEVLSVEPWWNIVDALDGNGPSQQV